MMPAPDTLGRQIAGHPNYGIGALWYTMITGEAPWQVNPDDDDAAPPPPDKLAMPPALHVVLCGALDIRTRRHHSAASRVRRQFGLRRHRTVHVGNAQRLLPPEPQTPPPMAGPLRCEPFTAGRQPGYGPASLVGPRSRARQTSGACLAATSSSPTCRRLRHGLEQSCPKVST